MLPVNSSSDVVKALQTTENPSVSLTANPRQGLLCAVPGGGGGGGCSAAQMPHYDVDFWHQQPPIMGTVSFFLLTAPGNGAVTSPLRSIKQPSRASFYFSHDFYWKIPNNFLSCSPAHTHLTYPRYTVNRWL